MPETLLYKARWPLQRTEEKGYLGSEAAFCRSVIKQQQAVTHWNRSRCQHNGRQRLQLILVDRADQFREYSGIEQLM